MRRRGGRGTGDESPPDPTKGPHRWKASRIITSRRSSRAGGHGGLGSSLTFRRKPAKVGPNASGRGRSDRDVRGSVDRGHRGKKTPTLVAAAGQQPAKHEAKVTQQENSECCVLDDPPKRSGRRESVRFPSQAARSPNSGRRPRGESRGSAAGNIRGAGARSSFRWQKSIGRIVRLVHREVARPRGEKQGRALAGRKLEAPLTKSTSGEKAKRFAGEHTRSKVGVHLAHGFRLVGSRDDGRHSRASAHLALTGGMTLESSALRSNTERARLNNACVTGSASGGTETDSGVPEGDIRECQRSTWSGEGDTRSEKDRGSSASSALKRRRSSGASGHARSKLAARIASSNPPPS